MLGIYGLIAFIVTGRTREIGIRRAVGASTASIVIEVLVGSGKLVAAGVIAGYPVADVRVTLLGGAHAGLESGVAAFKLAGAAAFKEGMRRAGPKLLEPIMNVEVVTPEEYSGDVIGDLNRRRGQITGMDESPSGKVVTAEVPLSEMFGYATSVRSMSQGRATFTMQFDRYEEVPQSIAGEIVDAQS